MAYLVALIALAVIIVMAWRHRMRISELDHRTRELARQLTDSHAEVAKAGTLMRDLVTLDVVTGVANHGRFQDVLRSEWRRALREASPISVILIDIDHFREYNDEFGHQAGDECLARLAKTITELIGRPGDLVARYGGEEFAVILARTDPQGAYRVAYKLRAAIEALRLPHPRSRVGDHVTVSIGVASATPALDSSWEELELVAAADQAVTKAKSDGRNQVVA